ncbi:MAG: [FeFe] hydrogenase H-cluster radical SAM maturase HydG [Endomicrobiales bacterium]
MHYINEQKIFTLLSTAEKATRDDIARILAKARGLKRLTLDETATLLCARDPQAIEDIQKCASYVKDAIYGRRVVMFAPMYITSFCSNRCAYCAFTADNKIERRHLSIDEIKSETVRLLEGGHKRILVVAGEEPSGIDFYIEAIRAIYGVRVGNNAVKRININCAPVKVDDFLKLKAAGIGTFQIFQETYHEQTYRCVHPAGTAKHDPDNRLDAVDRAFAAGIDDIGIGVLYGLYDWRFDTLAMLMHVEAMEQRHGVGPHTISVPRLEPAAGINFFEQTPYKVSDDDFKRIVSVIRLSVPYTGLILSTRENASMRDELINRGVSQISAASRTTPGGYSTGGVDASAGQFATSDHRSLEEMVGLLISQNNIPSFCAACYRKERTGAAFMDLAKPGAIKKMCNVNALITLKEYLEDFASPEVRRQGYELINRFKNDLSPDEQHMLNKMFTEIDAGSRDKYV